jgi:hypothetical protein
MIKGEPVYCVSIIILLITFTVDSLTIDYIFLHEKTITKKYSQFKEYLTYHELIFTHFQRYFTTYKSYSIVICYYF